MNNFFCVLVAADMSLADWFSGIFSSLGVAWDTDYFTAQQIIVILGLIYMIQLLFNIISSLFDVCKGR